LRDDFGLLDICYGHFAFPLKQTSGHGRKAVPCLVLTTLVLTTLPRITTRGVL
jgi:hypothetical protein